MKVVPVKAFYLKDQPVARYRSNVLIEALPPAPSEQEIRDGLEYLPPFEKETRKWDTLRRLTELLTLTNIMVPLTSHVLLNNTLDGFIREGYVGREPLSAAHFAKYQEIHDERGSYKRYRQTHTSIVSKRSTALVGVPGMGKTTTVVRALGRYPQVIYHEELDVYQITWLLFILPTDGKGVKGLLSNIITEIAKLIPGNTYERDHLRNGRASEDSLQGSVETLLNKHFVGLLVADEIQNVANSSRSDQHVMTALTTLASKSDTPVLYIGTPKAERILGLDLRQGRRSIDLGVGNWDPLPRHDVYVDREGRRHLRPGEWERFMTAMWEYNWTRKPVKLTEALLNTFYECTQGIIDLAIKLFIVAQALAMLGGHEMLSEQVIREAYQQHFKLVHPMIDAMLKKDLKRLAQFEDIRLPKSEVVVEAFALEVRTSRNHAVNTRPGSVDFEDRLADAGAALGLPEEDAQALARSVAEDGSAKNMLQAVAQMAKKATPSKTPKPKASRWKKDAKPVVPNYKGLEGRPDDLRNAVVAAAALQSSVLDQLVALRLVRDVEEVICLD